MEITAFNTPARVGSWSSAVSTPLQMFGSFRWQLPSTRRGVIVADLQNSNFRWWAIWSKSLTPILIKKLPFENMFSIVCRRRRATTSRANVAAEAVRVPTSVPVRVAHELAQAGYRYLDVRTPDEFSIGHPSSAINVPYMYRVGSGFDHWPLDSSIEMERLKLETNTKPKRCRDGQEP